MLIVYSHTGCCVLCYVLCADCIFAYCVLSVSCGLCIVCFAVDFTGLESRRFKRRRDRRRERRRVCPSFSQALRVQSTALFTLEGELED